MKSTCWVLVEDYEDPMDSYECHGSTVFWVYGTKDKAEHAKKAVEATLMEDGHRKEHLLGVYEDPCMIYSYRIIELPMD